MLRKLKYRVLSLMLCCFGISVVLSAGGKAADNGVQVQGQAGSEIFVRRIYPTNRRCTVALPKIRIPKPPIFGEIVIRRKPARIRSNRRELRGCNGRRITALFLYYHTDPGFAGIDDFQYEYTNPFNGAIARRNVSVHVGN